MFNNFLRSILLLLIFSSSWVIYTSVEQRKHLDQFSDDYIWQLKTSIKNATRNFLMPAKNIVKLGAYLIEQDLISLDKPESLKAFVYPFIETYPQFNGYFVGDQNKEFWFWHNTYAKNYVYRIQTITRNIEKQLVEQKNFLDKDRNSLRKSTPLSPEYDPTTRLWYKGATAIGGFYWSDVYSFDSDREHLIPGVTASYPIYKNQQLMGVWGVDIVLSELSNFLFDAGSSRATDLVIFNEQEKVIAYSGFKNVEIKQRLITLKDLKKNTIKKALTSYQEHGFNEFYFSEQGIRYLVSYSSLLFSDEQEWHLLLVVPESQLSQNMGNDLYLTALFAVFVLIISLLRFVYLLRQPLSISVQKLSAKNLVDKDKIMKKTATNTSVDE
ncbi:MAG: hypothetical protein JKX78_14930 [Alteromonadaceae bacterium]|nr:hypothetical protein [Alteromonadaceae bacterium]